MLFLSPFDLFSLIPLFPVPGCSKLQDLIFSVVNTQRCSFKAAAGTVSWPTFPAEFPAEFPLKGLRG